MRFAQAFRVCGSATVFIASSFACTEATGLTGVDIQNLTLSVRPARASVMTGDTVMIVIKVVNRSGRTLDLNRGACGPLAFEVRTSAGTRISTGLMSPCGSLDAQAAYRLAPADSLFIGLTWRAVSNFEGQLATEREPLPPGLYTVFGGLVSADANDRFAKRSPAVPLTILALGAGP